MKGILGSLTVVLFVASIAPPAGAVPIVLPRAGQVGFAVQGLYGGLTTAGNLGQEFGSGGTLAVRMIYRMRYERAIGLSFEELRLGTRQATADSSGAFPAPAPTFLPVARQQLAVNTEGLDLYQYFGTRTKTPLYLNAGLGLAQVAATQVDGVTVYPLVPDGYYLSAGVGLERFLYRSWALDASVRYMAILLDGSVNHDIHACLGVVLYAAY